MMLANVQLIIHIFTIAYHFTQNENQATKRRFHFSVSPSPLNEMACQSHDLEIDANNALWFACYGDTKFE